MTPEEKYWVEEPVPETPEPSEYPAPWKKTEVVGKRLPRIDAYERVSGTAVYPSDIVLPNMLYGAVLRSPHAHARVKKIDTAAAAKMPGVEAIFVPGSPEVQKVQWPLYRGADPVPLLSETCRFEGEPIAAVAAETPQQAADALHAIEVEYQVLPAVADERDALADGAPAVHDGGNRAGDPGRYERGDVEAGFTAAEVVLERSYHMKYQIHAPMELHGCVAQWDGNRLTVWESLQGVFSIQEQYARILGLPLANVRVVNTYMGGGFGSKLQTSRASILACLLAKKTARPVKLFATREEAMLVTGNRPGIDMRLKAGVTKEGALTALEFSGLSSAGAFSEGGAGLNDWLVKDLYTCANVKSENVLVHINAGPCRPFRAPGHPQGAWALEQMMDDLAEAIGMDPVELRLKNVPTVSQARGGRPYTTTGLKQCMVEGAEAFGWAAARTAPSTDGPIRHGVGMAACLWIAGGGGPPSTIIVKMYSDGSVNLNMGASDLGTGTRTVMAMVVAEELGIDPAGIQVENADTATTQFATSSGGSKTVPTESPAVREAAYNVKKQLLQMAADEHDLDIEDLMLTGSAVVSRSDPSVKFPVTELQGLRKRRVVVGIGYRGPNPENKTVNPFAAQFCEVEVNTRTGEVRVLRFLAAHESGRVLNRLTFDNQVFGGISMGIGYALTEQRVLDRGQTGKMVNANLHDYKIPTAMDVPAEMSSVVIDLEDTECNTTGAKGVGEPVTIPTAAAIANAIYDAIGVRVPDGPITPGKILEALAAQGKEA
jgi:xanthine dehydrogenase YagR molybdenum-binding subunit